MIVVGSVNVDLVVQARSLPAPGETVTEGTFSQVPGGKGGNQAAAAARLGAETFFVGMVGNDDFGRLARADLEAAGVSVSELRSGSRHTGVAAILVDERGENCIAVASGANHELDAAMVQSSLAAVGAPGAVVVSNLEIPDDAVAAAARAAAVHGCRFLLNPAPARSLGADVLRACDVLTPNEHELHALGSVDALLDSGVRAVVVTRGAAGADLARPGVAPHRQPAFPVTVVDTTGAGDAFSAALAWALSDGRDLEEAVRLAAAAGALATRAVGARAGLPSRAEVEDMARA